MGVMYVDRRYDRGNIELPGDCWVVGYDCSADGQLVRSDSHWTRVEVGTGEPYVDANGDYIVVVFGSRPEPSISLDMLAPYAMRMYLRNSGLPQSDQDILFAEWAFDEALSWRRRTFSALRGEHWVPPGVTAQDWSSMAAEACGHAGSLLDSAFDLVPKRGRKPTRRGIA